MRAIRKGKRKRKKCAATWMTKNGERRNPRASLCLRAAFLSLKHAEGEGERRLRGQWVDGQRAQREGPEGGDRGPPDVGAQEKRGAPS